DFADEQFIVSAKGSTYHDAVIHLCYQAGFSPKIALELPEILTIVAFVSQGMGIAIVPSSFQHQQNMGIVYREIEEVNANLEICFVYRKEEKSPVLREFLKL